MRCTSESYSLALASARGMQPRRQQLLRNGLQDARARGLSPEALPGPRDTLRRESAATASGSDRNTQSPELLTRNMQRRTRWRMPFVARVPIDKCNRRSGGAENNCASLQVFAGPGANCATLRNWELRVIAGFCRLLAPIVQRCTIGNCAPLLGGGVRTSRYAVTVSVRRLAHPAQLLHGRRAAQPEQLAHVPPRRRVAFHRTASQRVQYLGAAFGVGQAVEVLRGHSGIRWTHQPATSNPVRAAHPSADSPQRA